MRLDDGTRIPVRVAAEGPDGWSVRVRRVGYVPVRHHNTPIDADTDGVGQIPGYVPDPLFDEDSSCCPPARRTPSGSPSSGPRTPPPAITRSTSTSCRTMA